MKQRMKDKNIKKIINKIDSEIFKIFDYNYYLEIDKKNKIKNFNLINKNIKYYKQILKDVLTDNLYITLCINKHDDGSKFYKLQNESLGKESWLDRQVEKRESLSSSSYVSNNNRLTQESNGIISRNELPSFSDTISIYSEEYINEGLLEEPISDFLLRKYPNISESNIELMSELIRNNLFRHNSNRRININQTNSYRVVGVPPPVIIETKGEIYFSEVQEKPSEFNNSKEVSKNQEIISKEFFIFDLINDLNNDNFEKYSKNAAIKIIKTYFSIIAKDSAINKNLTSIIDSYVREYVNILNLTINDKSQKKIILEKAEKIYKNSEFKIENKKLTIIDFITIFYKEIYKLKDDILKIQNLNINKFNNIIFSTVNDYISEEEFYKILEKNPLDIFFNSSFIKLLKLKNIPFNINNDVWISLF